MEASAALLSCRFCGQEHVCKLRDGAALVLREPKSLKPIQECRGMQQFYRWANLIAHLAWMPRCIWVQTASRKSVRAQLQCEEYVSAGKFSRRLLLHMWGTQKTKSTTEALTITFG